MDGDEDFNIWEDVDFSKPGKDISHLGEQIKTDIEMHMKRRLVASTWRLMAKCEVSCHAYEGIDAIKDSLQEGFKASKDGLEVNIKLIAHPVFALTCMCQDKQLGVNVLTAALDLIKVAIESKKGVFSIISQPNVQKKEEEKGDDEDSDSDGDSDADKKSYKSQSDAEEQDVGMGDLDEEAMKALEKIKVDDD